MQLVFGAGHANLEMKKSDIRATPAWLRHRGKWKRLSGHEVTVIVCRINFHWASCHLSHHIIGWLQCCSSKARAPGAWSEPFIYSASQGKYKLWKELTTFIQGAWQFFSSLNWSGKISVATSQRPYKFIGSSGSIVVVDSGTYGAEYLDYNFGFICCMYLFFLTPFSLVQFSCLVASNSLWPYGLQRAKRPCPSPTPGIYSDSRPLSRWCHPTISSSVIPFSSCLQSFPASESFQMSQFFASSGQSIGVSASASVLPMNIQDWFPLGWTSWISLLSKGLSRIFSDSSKASILQCSAFFIVQLSHPYITTGKNIALTRRTFVGKVVSLLFNMLSC